MDRRLHNRALADLDVEVTRLKSKDRVTGRIEDVSESGMCLILPCELAADEMVRIEAADCSVFGYVIHCKWQRNAYRIGIEVQRVLLGNTDLAELMRSVLQNTMPRVTLSIR